MKQIFSLLLLTALSQNVSAQQLPNSNFEGKWVSCYPWESGSYASTERGSQPEGWNISNVSNTAMPIVGSQETGADGTGSAVKLSNVSVMGQNAPGYITLGTCWATAETKMTTVRNADGGVFGGIPFAYHPDAVRLTYKHSISSGAENMSVIAYLWKGTWTQQDVPSNTSVGVFSYGTATKVTMTDRIQNILGKECLTGGTITHTEDAELIASVEYYSGEAQNEWVTKEFPLNYGKYAGQPVGVEKFNIVIASNGLFDDRASIKSGNSVTIDDVELVYYHALSSLAFEGATINFSEKTTAYNLSSVEYDESKLSYTVKGQAAKAATSYNTETGILTIRVEGEDIAVNPQSYTEYTIQFKADGIEPSVLPEAKTYSLDLYVTIDGVTGEKQVADILVETLGNGNINFLLKNFVLGSGSEAMPVGNISVENLEVAENGTFAFKGGIQLTEGDDPAYTQWYGPTVTSMAGGSVPVDLKGQYIGEDEMAVYISIDMENTIGYSVVVHLGYTQATMSVSADDKYSTFCAPFAIKLPNGITAYTVESAKGGGVLSLSEVSFFLPANTPIVVFAENGLATTEFYGLPVEGEPVNGMLTGVFEETVAPSGCYVLGTDNGRLGFYPVADGQQALVGANRCYLTSTTGAKAYYFEAVEIPGHVPFDLTQELYNTLKGATAGAQAWDANGGIRLGNSSEVFKWNNRYCVIQIAGIPDKLSFSYSSSSGASSRKYVIYESADGQNFTEIWRDNKGSGVDGNSYQSGDIQLRPDTRFIKFFYYGNCAAYYRNVKVTELVKFASDTNDLHLNETDNTATFTFIHANASEGLITITAPDGIAVEYPEMIGGADIYGEQQVSISYDVNKGDVDDDIIISNGKQSETVHVVARMEDPTAIRGVTKDKEATQMYNVSGQRISKMQSGINIVGGKKVLK